MLTAGSALALFLMLALSSITLFIAGRLKVPHTVALVGVGVALGFAGLFPPFSFFGDIVLSPELLFYFFLPILIFESAFNINIRRLTEDTALISLLSIVSLLVSTAVTAVLTDVILSLLGFDIPLILAVLFGAIISATDPVAVLALFKEYGAPRRLSLIFEGESIFNDGTAVALFLVVLAIAESGAFHAESVVSGTVSFCIMVAGGILFGLLFGGFFAKAIGYAKSNEFAAITLTMVLAHSTFICAELFSQHAEFFGHPIHISAIIATAVASLVMGNYGRFKLPVAASEFVEKYWAQFAFLANSIIFILIGMLAFDLPTSAPQLLVPVIASIAVVALARAMSIYPVVALFNAFASAPRRIPRSWQHVLSWGSLRGALAVTMVLLIPDTLTFAGWAYPFTPKDLVLTLTVGCIFTTLFIKATTMGTLMRRQNLDTFTPLEEINYREMLLHIYQRSLADLSESQQKGYVTENVYRALAAEQEGRMREIHAELTAYARQPDTFEKVIRLHAIGIERKFLRELLLHDEIPEAVAKRIHAKLEYQSTAIEHDEYSEQKYEHGKDLDVFESIATHVRTFLYGANVDDTAEMQYLYYRALAIISRKVAKELPALKSCFAEDFLLPRQLIDETIERYAAYRRGSTSKMKEIATTHGAEIAALDQALARKALLTNQLHLLESRKEREMVTPKVFLALEERFTEESK